MPKINYMERRILDIKDYLMIESYLYKKKEIFKQYVLRFGIKAVAKRLQKVNVIENVHSVEEFMKSTTEQKDMFGMNEKELKELEVLRKNDNR